MLSVQADTQPLAQAAVEPIPPDMRRPLRRAEYQQLVELGVFQDERVELLDGVLINMSPQGVIHAWSVQQLAQTLTLSLAGRALVRVQNPFAASDLSLPEPDIAVVPLDTPRDDHPTQALLLVEVSGSSLDKDRHAKARLYAMNGVPEYWVVNLTAQAIEVYSQPAEGCYGRRQTYRRGETIGLVGVDGVGVEVGEAF